MSGSEDKKPPPDLPRGLLDRSGAPAGRTARLTPLRTSRELTLGGVPRRVFTPNIAGLINRQRPTAEEKAPAGPTEDGNKLRGRQGRGQGRGRGGGRGRGRGREDNLIQIRSVFEQGPSAQTKMGSGGSRGSGAGDGGGGGGKGSRGSKSSGPRSSSGPNRLGGQSGSQLGDDLMSDGPDEDPMMLPVLLSKGKASAMETGLRKQEKKPPADDMSGESQAQLNEDSPSTTNESSPSTAASSDTFPEVRKKKVTCAQLLTDAAKSDKHRLLFVQLPNILPGTPADEEEPMTDANGTWEDKSHPKCALRNFAEGYLGKMRVRKSGKVELVLGNVVLDVSMGTSSSILQEVVSVRTDKGDERMTVLGHVKEKLLMTPDFDSLLAEKGAKKR